jgi:hypothetical protein
MARCGAEKCAYIRVIFVVLWLQEDAISSCDR